MSPSQEREAEAHTALSGSREMDLGAWLPVCSLVSLGLLPMRGASCSKTDPLTPIIARNFPWACLMIVSWVIPGLVKLGVNINHQRGLNVYDVGEPLMAGHQLWENLASEGDWFTLEPKCHPHSATLT